MQIEISCLGSFQSDQGVALQRGGQWAVCDQVSERSRREEVLGCFRLRDLLYNTFCVKMNFSELCPGTPEESCDSLGPFLTLVEEAEVSEYLPTTPPLLSHYTAPSLDIKTARKPLVLQPTTIRLNRVRGFISRRHKTLKQTFPGTQKF